MSDYKKKVLVLRSNPIFPDPRVEKIAKALNKNGFDVDALGWDRSGKLPLKDNLDEFRVFRIRIQAKYGSGLMNLPALLVWQFRLFIWLIFNRNKYEVIHACDFDTILPALFVKIFWKKSVVYDIFDFYADHLRRTPAFIKQIIRRWDFWAISKSDGVIIVDDSRREQIKDSHPRICVSIYNSPEDMKSNIGTNVIGFDKEIFTITYVGLLQFERGLLEMINIMKNHNNWFLNIAGFGGDEEKIVSMITTASNIEWYGRITYQKALELSNQADVLFATYDPKIPNHKYSSPNKVFEGMMLGKPIIVSKYTNMDQIIEDNNCGIVVEYGDEKQLEAALVSLEQDETLKIKLGNNARKAYESIYGWSKMEERLRDFYRMVLD